MNNPNPLKNFISIVFGRTGELIISFFAITILIRYLGTSQYGVFSSVVAMLGIFSRMIDLGFSQILFREFSAKSDKKNVINSAITIRIILFFGLVFTYNVLAALGKFNSEEIIITNILFFNIIISSKFRNFRDLLEIPFKSKLRMDIVMLATFIDSLFLIFFIIVGSYLQFSLIKITIFYTIANLPGFIILVYSLFKQKLISYQFSFKNITWLFKESIYLWGAGFLTMIFMQFDVVLLKNYRSAEEAGLFSAAIRIGVPLSILPLSLITTIFPIIVKNRSGNKETAKKIIAFSYKTLGFLIIFAALIITYQSKNILILLYGDEFKSAELSLILIFWSLLFFYLNQLTQNLLTIIGKQKFNLYYSILLVVIYLLVLFLSIIDYGIVGAGIARVVSSIIGFIFLSLVVYKSEFSTKIISFSNLLLLVTLAIIGYLINMLGNVWFFILFPLSSIVLLFLFRFYNLDDLHLFAKLLNEPKWLMKITKK